ncbi:hypothetical protein [Kitasatospora griseola]|uniref:hypothetical protein n=1 Tax=Kitasatospora griseola TaxID=2064 RepID=UPI00166F9D42|nr:hypothetical protein [Kitasatospora griseola]GGR07969.1 hypothetical protein GCM10010195_73530 [Kitasatospora griseola]
MSEQPLTFLPLSYAARPPRLVVVAPAGDDWVRWAAAALARLSGVWGCSGSVVLPAGTAGHPAVQRCLARLQPDHVVPYVPTWGTADEVAPGLIQAVVARRDLPDGSAAEQFEEFLRKDRWGAPAAVEADEDAAALRVRLVAGQREQELLHVYGLFDAEDEQSLTPLASIATAPLIGVPQPLVTTPAALAYAMHVGVEKTPYEGTVEPRQWLEAAVRGDESPLLSDLHPQAGADAQPMMSHWAARCIPVRRGYRQARSTMVLGDSPEDFALAQVLRQLHEYVAWLPEGDVSLASFWLFDRRHGTEKLKVTSASLTPDEVRARIDKLWDERGYQLIEPAEEKRPYTVVEPSDLELHGHSMVVLQTAWEQPRSLPASVAPDGSLMAALALAGEVPPGLDAARHRWQVTLTCANHPLPPLPELAAPAVTTADQDPWHTFVRAADGGITYWSHRFDFVPTGASLAGTLAAPKLLWPGIKKILHHAAQASETQLRPSAAGKRTAITERLLGSRKALEALAASSGWQILRLFLPDASHAELPAHSSWKLKSAVVLSWEAITAHESDGWNAAAARTQVDEWTTQGVLRRGLVLGCSHCPIFEFYPLAEISQQYRCRRCGGDNNLAQDRWKPFGEPRWFYDLHPAVLELVANDGDVPLLATQYLRTQPQARPALVGEEFELLKNGSPFVEIDFALTTSDELWLGEAKKTDSLAESPKARKREICKLIDGCTAVGAHRLILATAQPAWADATIDALRQEVRGRRSAGRPVPEVQLLTGLRSKPELSWL